MKLTYFITPEGEEKVVNVKQTGKIVLVSQADPPYDEFTAYTNSLAYSFAGVANITCEDFVSNYVYIEKLSTGELRRAIFDVVTDGVRKYPKLVDKEVIDENQLAVLCMLHNVLLD